MKKLSPIARKAASVARWVRRAFVGVRRDKAVMLSPTVTTVADSTAGACKASAHTTPQWPMPVSCYGRTYEAPDQTALDELLGWLVERRLRMANRYRVGASWPRGQQKFKAIKAGPMWYCKDCDRKHRSTTARCPVSNRWRAEITGEPRPSGVYYAPEIH